jgi:hypothetical protein
MPQSGAESFDAAPIGQTERFTPAEASRFLLPLYLGVPAVLALVVGAASPAAARVVAFPLIGVGALTAVGAAFWLWALALELGVLWLLATLAFPIVGLVVMSRQRNFRPLLLNVIAVMMVVGGAILGAGADKLRSQGPPTLEVSTWEGGMTMARHFDPFILTITRVDPNGHFEGSIFWTHAKVTSPVEGQADGNHLVFVDNDNDQKDVRIEGTRMKGTDKGGAAIFEASLKP